MARQRDYAAEYQRRVERARELGYTGYSQQRAVKEWVAQQRGTAGRRAGVEAAALRALRRAGTMGQRGTKRILDDWRKKVQIMNGRETDDEESWAYYHVG